jgi:hypothetical protein
MTLADSGRQALSNGPSEDDPTGQTARTMHTLIASPFLDDYLVLRPDDQRAVKIGVQRYRDLRCAATRADAPVPPWLVDAARQRWDLDLDGRTLAEVMLVREPSPLGYGRASDELNLGCNYDCEHCYLGLKRFEGMSSAVAPVRTPMRHRITWDELPEATRAAIIGRTGPVHAARTVSGGRNSPLAAVLDTATGPVFVKGLPVGHRSAATQAREAATAPHVAEVAPALLWHLPDAAGWNVLGFEYVEGRHADYPPGSPDLAAVVELLARVGEIDYPDDAPARDARRAFASYVDDPDAAGLLGGTTLLHTDYNPENVLIGSDGPRLVDWAWPCRGAAWIDPCVLIVRLVAAGHTPEAAEECVADVSAWRTAPAVGVRVFAAVSVRLWGEIADQDPQPWKRDMATAARAWAQTRLAAM